MRTIWGLAGMGLLFALPLWAADPVVGSPLQAVWKEQRLDFSYMGRTARYSCDGLRDKMRSLLLDLGARRDLQVSLYACDESAPLRRRAVCRDGDAGGAARGGGSPDPPGAPRAGAIAAQHARRDPRPRRRDHRGVSATATTSSTRSPITRGLRPVSSLIRPRR